MRRIFLNRLSKNSQISNFMKIRLRGGGRVVPYGRTDRQMKLIVAFRKFWRSAGQMSGRAKIVTLLSSFPFHIKIHVAFQTQLHCRKFLCSVDKQLTLSTSLAGTFLPISCSATSQRLRHSPLRHLLCCNMYGTFLDASLYIPNAVSSSDFRILRVDAWTQRGLVCRLLAL